MLHGIVYCRCRRALAHHAALRQRAPGALLLALPSDGRSMMQLLQHQQPPRVALNSSLIRLCVRTFRTSWEIPLDRKGLLLAWHALHVAARCQPLFYKG